MDRIPPKERTMYMCARCHTVMRKEAYPSPRTESVHHFVGAFVQHIPQIPLNPNRESVRERGTEADTSTAPPSPASLDRFPPLPSLPIVQRHQQRQNDTPSPSIDPQLVAPPPPPPRGDEGSRSSAEGRELPVHPRQEMRIGSAYQAVFKAFARLLPPPAEGEARRIGVGSGGARAGMGVMRAAAVRCGLQCQGYIRALQLGIEVRACSSPGMLTVCDGFVTRKREVLRS